MHLHTLYLYIHFETQPGQVAKKMQVFKLHFLRSSSCISRGRVSNVTLEMYIFVTPYFEFHLLLSLNAKCFFNIPLWLILYRHYHLYL